MAKKKKGIVWRRHEVADADRALTNRRPYVMQVVMQVDERVIDVIPVTTQGGSLVGVDYDRADKGEVSFKFSNPMTILRAVLYTVAT